MQFFNKLKKLFNNESNQVSQPAKQFAYKFAASYQRSINATAIENGAHSLRFFYNAFGQLLYRIGYQTEYFFVCAIRAVKIYFNRLKFVATLTPKILLQATKKAGHFLFTDFIEPWKKVRTGFLHVRDEINYEYDKSGYRTAAKKGVGYFIATCKAVIHLILPLLGYLLPLGAMLIFIYAVNTMNNFNFGLSVRIGEEDIGFISNEVVFEDAQALVRERIRSTKEGDKWSVSSSFEISVGDKRDFKNSTFIADKMVEASSDKIQNATGLIIDGELLGVTIEGDKLKLAIDTIKEPYMEPENPNLTVDFVKQVELVDGIYYTSSLTEVDPIITTLTGQVSGEQLYSVVKGDSPSGIASKLGVPLKDIYALNPQIDPSINNKISMKIGDQLLISNAVDFLQVKTVERVRREIAIPHQVIKTNSKDLEWGRQNVTIAGADGLEERHVDITRIGGYAVSEEIVSSVILQEPVTQEITIGVRLANGGVAGDASTGNMIWPVPSSRSMSRGWSGGHRALDIRGPYGTPIVAADNGIVLFSGKGTGSYWSYGNFVQVQHSNGIVTRYAHMSSVAVASGSYVQKGQVIGYMGSTGRSTGNHLHFETIVGGAQLDPFRYVKR